MRKLKLILAAGVLAAVTGGSTVLACPGHDKGKAEAKQQVAPAHVATASFRVQGMHCAGCADELKTALVKVDGVVTVDVKLADHRVTVAYDKDKTTPEKIAKLMADLGFPAAAEA